MNFEWKIKAIVQQVDGLPKKDCVNVLEYLEHSEWGVALEHLCATIYEENIYIPVSVLEQIKEVSIQMGIWKEIREQLNDLYQ
ncbi:MafI family immunity protein [Neobacillus sp. DY30]|uniref:MafI family immunity protein n=1 Tax=Neobacillus sp. DY30 TaxID=3047871 RepID=UPI0024C05358|nr:MafI family immunity protein [Neobacillus sp. DY30]WHY03236.1 MafI family immunity protein [Neobacillus sp. DY30]